MPKDFTPTLEVASIDEYYLDLHGTNQGPRRGAKMQKSIEQSLKLSVSVGVGSNKLVSQITSKQRGCIEVAPGHEQGFLWPLAMIK